MRALKWLLGLAAALALVMLAAAAIIAATFDPNQYKAEIVRLVKERTGRTLTMDGPIALTFVPRVGAHVERVALSGPGGQGMFARVEDARVAVSLLPLLSRRVVVDRVSLNGLAVELVRFKDGRTNFDDLAPPKATPPAQSPQAPAAPPAPLAVDIGGIVLRDATIGWRDERAGTDLTLADVTLDIGRVSSGAPGRLKLAAKLEGKAPRVSVRLDGSTEYRVDFDTLAVSLSAVDVRAAGDAAGLAGLDARMKSDRLDLHAGANRVDVAGLELSARSKDGLDARLSIPKLQLAPDQAEGQPISGEVKLAEPERKIDAKLALSALQAKGKLVSFSRLDVDLDVRAGGLAVEGKVGTPVVLDLEASQAQLPGIAGDLTLSGPNMPNESLKLALRGDARADWAKHAARTALAVRLDESSIQAVVAVANWAKPSVSFDVRVDRLDVDRYLPPRSAPVSADSAAKGTAPAPGGRDAKGTAPAPAGGDTKGTPAASGTDVAEKPIDLSALRSLDAAGTLRVGALQVSRIKAANVNAGITAAGGRVDINPLAAGLYQGSMAGTAVVDANRNSFAVKQQFSNVRIGPLLRDVAQQDLLEGVGNLSLDVTTSGVTPSALKKALNGTGALALRDGAIKGIDVAGTIRRAKALLGSRRSLDQHARVGDRTEFTELSATFVVRNGVARNDDLLAKSPLLRLAGAGDVDIGNGVMDYTLKATVVATSTGQGGKEFAAVRGVTAPIRITGPFDNPAYSVDVAALATEAAADALARELERRLGGGQAGKSKSGAPGERPGGALGDALRELFKR